MEGNKLISQEKLDLLEANGFDWGGVGNPGRFVRIKNLDGMYCMKSTIFYTDVMDASIEKLKSHLSSLNDYEEMELHALKRNHRRGLAINSKEMG